MYFELILKWMISSSEREMGGRGRRVVAHTFFDVIFTFPFSQKLLFAQKLRYFVVSQRHLNPLFFAAQQILSKDVY